MTNELTVTKEQTARFVHDAVEMETAVFTLDRAIEECEGEKDKLIEKINGNHSLVIEYQKKLSNPTDSSKDGTVELKPLSTRILEALGEAISGALVVAVFGAIITFIILFLVEAYIDIFDSTGAFFKTVFCLACVEMIIGGIITFIVRFVPDKKQQKALEKQQKAVQKAKDSIYRKIAIIKRENHAHQAAIDYLDAQISDLRTKRSQIKSTLSRFYDLGVIPPDYRYMDCAIMLDQIFRNDLADTMRDAIKIYEERVFRGEVIKGMDKICSMLGNLSAGMMAIEQRLSSIDSNVKMMSQDLYTFSERIATGQAKQQKATEQLIRETELSRYATEQVAESSKNLEWFERRRQGWV